MIMIMIMNRMYEIQNLLYIIPLIKNINSAVLCFNQWKLNEF
jgi:hypothetical protein